MNIGDTVKITSFDYIYTTYHDWAALHGLDRLAKGHTYAAVGDIGVIIAKGYHGDTKNQVVYGIRCGGYDYMFNSRGLECVKEIEPSFKAALNATIVGAANE
jgi:hypothetical protein